MSSALSAAQKAIYSRVRTLWADRTPIAWDNVNFTPPDPGQGPAQWLKVDIAWGEGAAVSMGGAGARNTLPGVLFLTVFGPKNAAFGEIMRLCDLARDMVNRVEVNGVRFGVPSAPLPGEDPRWAMRQVQCGFTVDETI